jgi:hypothetical protein
MICERETIILVFALASSPRISLQRTFFAEQKFSSLIAPPPTIPTHTGLQTSIIISRSLFDIDLYLENLSLQN